jgi:hypothetical protein
LTNPIEIISVIKNEIFVGIHPDIIKEIEKMCKSGYFRFSSLHEYINYNLIDCINMDLEELYYFDNEAVASSLTSTLHTAYSGDPSNDNPDVF